MNTIHNEQEKKKFESIWANVNRVANILREGMREIQFFQKNSPLLYSMIFEP